MALIRIGVDFDNTLVFEDESGDIWPVPGAGESMRNLKDRGYEIIINTCRMGIADRNGALDSEINFVQDCLEQFNIPYDEIHLGEKLIADLYIDDRSIGFQGDWDETLSRALFALRDKRVKSAS